MSDFSLHLTINNNPPILFLQQSKFKKELSDFHLAAAILDPSSTGRRLLFLTNMYTDRYHHGNYLPSVRDCHEAVHTLMDHYKLRDKTPQELHPDLYPQQKVANSSGASARRTTGSSSQTPDTDIAQQNMAASTSSWSAQSLYLPVDDDVVPTVTETPEDIHNPTVEEELRQYTSRFEDMDSKYKNDMILAADYDKDKGKSILQFWGAKNIRKLFPKLSALAKRILPVPATSCPAERLFSGTGYTINDRRTNLAKETIEALTRLGSMADAGFIKMVLEGPNVGEIGWEGLTRPESAMAEQPEPITSDQEDARDQD